MNTVRNLMSVWLLQLAVKLSKVNHKAGIKTDGCFRTFTRRKFNILKPTSEMIDIEDIAKGLAYKPHFSGFSPRFFSIAEHSLMVEKMVAQCNESDYHARLEALLHDGSEAYTGDMIKPIKNLLPNFVLIENRIQKAVYAKYGINPKSYTLDIKYFDNQIQDIEALAFYRGYDSLSSVERFLVDQFVEYLTPDEAYSAFIERFNWLQNRIKESGNEK